MISATGRCQWAFSPIAASSTANITASLKPKACSSSYTIGVRIRTAESLVRMAETPAPKITMPINRSRPVPQDKQQQRQRSKHGHTPNPRGTIASMVARPRLCDKLMRSIL